MIEKELRQEIDLIIEEAKQALVNLFEYNLPNEPFLALKAEVIRQELQFEIDFVTQMLEQDLDPKNTFKKHYIARVETNKNTCLSYTALPEGHCNIFMAKIAQVLLKPANQSELIQWSIPQVRYYLNFELYTESSKKIEVRLKKQPIDDNFDLFPKTNFSDYIVHGDCLLDVSMIQNFSFLLHQSCHAQLQKNYPEFVDLLYSHNHALKMLRQDLQFVNQQGPIPYRVILDFANQLRFGGSGQTGQLYASSSAQQAFIEFKSYLASLPHEIRNKLLALSGSGLHSLDWVVNTHLGKNEGCVEQAATCLTDIVNSNSSCNVLMKHPTLSVAQVKEINQKYGPSVKTPLSTKAGAQSETNFNIPVFLIEKVSMDAAFLKMTTEDYLSVVYDYLMDTVNPHLSKHRDFGMQFRALEQVKDSPNTHFFAHESLKKLIAAIKTKPPTPEVYDVIKSTHDFLTGQLSSDQYMQKAQKMRTPIRNAAVCCLSILMFTLLVAVSFSVFYFCLGVLTGIPLIGITYGILFSPAYAIGAFMLMNNFDKCLRSDQRIPDAMINIAKNYSPQFFPAAVVDSTTSQTELLEPKTDHFSLDK